MQTLIEQIEKCGFIHQPVPDRSTTAVNCFFDYDSKKTYTTYDTGYVRVDGHTPVSKKRFYTEDERLGLILRIAKKNSYEELLIKAASIRMKIYKRDRVSSSLSEYDDNRLGVLINALKKVEARIERFKVPTGREIIERQIGATLS